MYVVKRISIYFKLRGLAKELAGRLTKTVEMLQACGHQEADDV